MRIRSSTFCLLSIVCAYSSYAQAPANSVHLRNSSYWSAYEGRQSTVQLRNNSYNIPIAITPILYLGNGTAVELDSIALGPLANGALDINRVLLDKGLPPDSEGSLAFRYTGAANALSAETLIVQAEHSLSYTIPSYEERSSSPHQYFAYFRPSPNSEIYIAMQNTSGEAMRVEPSVQIGDRTLALNSQTVGPHQVKTLHFPDDLDAAGQAVFQASEIGGVTLNTQDGPSSALNTSGWVEDESLGFSTMLSFHDPAMTSGHELFGTQILFGEQASLGKTAFSSLLLLRNITSQAVSFTARFIYERDGVPFSTMLPLAPLDPQEIRKVLLWDLQRQGVIPQDVRSGALVVDYSGNNGDVMGRVFSMSEDGSLGLYTALEPFGAVGGNGVYWTADGDWNTILTVTNFSDAADTASLTLTHRLGQFTLPPIPLAPGKSATVSLKDIVSGAVKSADGKAWPNGVTSGGFRLMGGRVRSKLVIKEQTVEPAQKLATPFYIIAPVATGACLVPSTFNLLVDESATFKVDILYSSPCSGGVPDDQATVTIDSTAIASVSMGFDTDWTVTGKMPGTATLTGTTKLVAIDTNIPADVARFTATGTVNVSPRVTVSGDPGIPYEDTADYAITVTPDGPVTLTLTSSGSGSATFAGTGGTSRQLGGSGVVTVRGIAASSKTGDILLQAQGQQGGRGSQNISVVKVTISLSSSGDLSTDNSAKDRYHNLIGPLLGRNIQHTTTPNGCVVGVELVGNVMPTDWTGKIEMRRKRLGARVYHGQNGTARDRDREPTGVETSDPLNRDDDPQSNGSNGKVYDFDAPGAGAVDPGEIERLRLNLHEYAVFSGEPTNSTKELGSLDWYARTSCQVLTSGPELAGFVDDPQRVPGDNQAAPGSTRLTWDLK